MPPRSNPFQHLVFHIAQQLAPLGAVVRESVELLEQGSSGIKREIDTLIEIDAGLVRVAVAIEARDRSRKDDIEWIDQLIGKYKSLPVDRVIAISHAGFSASAVEKAALHRIEVLSPEKVRDTNWPEKFQRLGVASITSHYHLAGVQFSTNPEINRGVSANDEIHLELDDGTVESGPVAEFVKVFGPGIVKIAKAHVQANFLSLYKTLEDLSKLAMVFGSFAPPQFRASLSIDDRVYQVEKLSWRVVAVTNPEIVPVSHELLGPAVMLSSAEVGWKRVTVAQTPATQTMRVIMEVLKGKDDGDAKGAT